MIKVEIALASVLLIYAGIADADLSHSNASAISQENAGPIQQPVLDLTRVSWDGATLMMLVNNNEVVRVYRSLSGQWQRYIYDEARWIPIDAGATIDELNQIIRAYERTFGKTMYSRMSAWIQAIKALSNKFPGGISKELDELSDFC